MRPDQKLIERLKKTSINERPTGLYYVWYEPSGEKLSGGFKTSKEAEAHMQGIIDDNGYDPDELTVMHDVKESCNTKGCESVVKEEIRVHCSSCGNWYYDNPTEGKLKICPSCQPKMAEGLKKPPVEPPVDRSYKQMDNASLIKYFQSLPPGTPVQKEVQIELSYRGLIDHMKVNLESVSEDAGDCVRCGDNAQHLYGGKYCKSCAGDIDKKNKQHGQDATGQDAEVNEYFKYKVYRFDEKGNKEFSKTIGSDKPLKLKQWINIDGKRWMVTDDLSKGKMPEAKSDTPLSDKGMSSDEIKAEYKRDTEGKDRLPYEEWVKKWRGKNERRA